MNFETVIKEYLKENPNASLDDAGKMLSHALNAIKEEQENAAKEAAVNEKVDNLLTEAAENICHAASFKYSANEVNLLKELFTADTLMNLIETTMYVLDTLPNGVKDFVFNLENELTEADQSATMTCSDAYIDTELFEKLTGIPGIKVKVCDKADGDADKIIKDSISKLI